MWAEDGKGRVKWQARETQGDEEDRRGKHESKDGRKGKYSAYRRSNRKICVDIKKNEIRFFI